MMENIFRMEVDTGSGGYGLNVTLTQLLWNVEDEYGKAVSNEVENWALNSKENDEFNKYGMYIANLGKEE